MRTLQFLSRCFDLVAEPGVWPYLMRTGKPSLASYRMCQAVKSLVGTPGTIFDIGANQGQFTSAAAWWFEGVSIIAFEPSPTVASLMRRNTRKIAKLELVQSAVGDRPGELDFYESEYSHASSALVVTEAQRSLRPETARVQKVIVPVTTLDDFAAGRKWPGPVLLKLDVQGYERNVLKGATEFLRTVDWLLFECSYRPLYEGEPLFAEMYSYVSSLGFELVAAVGHLEDENHVMLQADLLWRRIQRVKQVTANARRS